MFDLMITLLSINQIETNSWSINKMIILKKKPSSNKPAERHAINGISFELRMSFEINEEFNSYSVSNWR